MHMPLPVQLSVLAKADEVLQRVHCVKTRGFRIGRLDKYLSQDAQAGTFASDILKVPSF